MYKYKDNIFSLFGKRFKTDDINKDAEGKGFFERFNEIFGSDIDNFIKPKIENLVQNLINPETFETRLFEFKIKSFGVNYTYNYTNIQIRKVMMYWLSWHKMRGTKRGLKSMLYFLGFDSVTYEKDVTYGGYDTLGVSYDDVNTSYDSETPINIKYFIKITGSIILSDLLKIQLLKVIDYHVPFSKKNNVEIQYNGTKIEDITGVENSFDNSFDNSFK